MVVEVKEQVEVLTQPLLEPGALLIVEFDDLLGDGPLNLAHGLQDTRRRPCSGRAQAVATGRS